MKIAFVVHDYNKGFGHSRYVAELATRFAAEHEVHVFSNTVEGDLPSAIRFHHVPAWRANAFTTVLTFLPMAMLTVRGRFDLVHSQGMCVWRSDVVTAHQINREWYNARRRTARLAWREHVFGTVVSGLEGLFYRRLRSGEAIAISTRVREDLQRHYGCPAPTTVIHHGTDLDTFSPRQRAKHRGVVRSELGIGEDEVLFAFVGDMRKGASQAIRALAELSTGRLVFVSRSRTTEWMALARELNVSRRIVFAGPSSEVERYYAAADAFVLPTPNDAFALVATEAMASGLPVIVSVAAGASELIEDGTNGLLLNDYVGHAELAHHMQRLVADAVLRRRLGEAAARSAQAWGWDAVAVRTMAVYTRVARPA